MKTVNRRRGLFLLFLAVFIDLLGFGIVIPLLPFWSIDLGLSTLAFGALVSSYSAMQFIFAPIWGRFSDRIGRRPVILIGLSGTVVGFTLLALTALFIDSLVMLFLSRIISGIFTAATLPTSQAYISDSTSEKERTKDFGLLGAAFGIGFAIGPAAGGILFSVGKSLGLVGYETPALFALVLAIINLLGAIRFLPESLTSDMRMQRALLKAKSESHSRFEIFNLLTKSSIILVLVVVFSILSLSFSGMEATLALLGKARFNLDQTLTGVVFLVVGLVAIVTQGGLIRALSKRFSDAVLISTGILILIVSYLGISTVYSLVGMASWVIPLAFGMSISNPALTALLSKKTPKERQGQIFGMNQGMGSLMRIIGPILGTTLLAIDVSYPYYAGAALLLMAFLLMPYVLRKAGEKIPTTTACPYCGARLQEGVAYCGQCGKAL